MPVVMGEIILGIVLGPTLLGKIAPELSAWIYPVKGNAAIVIQGLTALSVIMLLFVAGLEVKLDMLFKEVKAATLTSLTSIIIPFLTGFGIVWLAPEFFTFKPENKMIFSLFLGVAMAISALPVIIRILMDLGIYQSRIGTVIVAAAVVDDLVGWITFSLILSMLGQHGATPNPWMLFGLILLFAGGLLTVGRAFLNRLLPWVQVRLPSPDLILSLCVGACFMGAFITASLGLHALLGSFMVGVTFADSKHLPQSAHNHLEAVVTQVFAPLFFLSIGLKVNFISNFDLGLVLLVLLVAFVCKLAGASLGAYLGGLNKKEILTIGFGLNARGAMEIILSSLALSAGLIDSKLFVALVFMALVTSIISCPLMKHFAGSSAIHQSSI